MQNNQKIPVGWNKVFLKSLSLNGITNGIFNNPTKVGQGIPLINVVDLYNNKIDLDHLSLLDVSEDELKRYETITGDLLFTRSSLKLEGIAQCNIVPNKNARCVFDCHIMRIRPNIQLVNPYYLFTYCNTNIARKQFMKLSKTTTMTTIDQVGLGHLEVLLPPLPEQEKIAGILGTWDEAIEKLSSLIEQKKLLKKGLMQRLLTGKTRLNGFTQPWKEVKLGEILVERNEYTTQNNQVTILTSSRKGIFRQEDYFDKQVASENNIGYKILHKYDFTYRAMTDDDVYCFNQLINEDMGAVSPAYSVFYCENVPNLLIKEILNSKCFGYQLLKISQGGTRKSLKFSALKTLKIYIPSDINEQQAIADVLSTVDKEIDILNKKLEALKEQKKGLMQQLLTGQTRVKVN